MFCAAYRCTLSAFLSPWYFFCPLEESVRKPAFFYGSFFNYRQMKKTQNEKTIYIRATEYVYSVFSTLLISLAVIFTAFLFFFRLVQVDGDSMNPTLENYDEIIVSNFLYTPDYSDIIAIDKEVAGQQSIIKRVIALPGDTVYIDFETHLISVNSKVIHENYEVLAPIAEQGDFTYPLTVPDDCVFVLGDNRNNSLDSRFEKIGFIKLDEIAGKALIRLVPFGKFNIYS